ncbi:Gfo/Idh/MocA family protein [Curtobacterium sp. ISL-83]|uniref:Gfo/Idh/MocA family protein n=1 Tax=Curtobacterium sp. ISL-83 TaxID=2819145 RepID=UPI001BE53F35|nr:Gfo/Idh/MocA family oxidoreductase [Curtobacterium sp. ISL-83]MBT2502270.1 Gfo/Idh/MocA family oxidoreductase [Curtobacterium sp. ISL-83]
MSAAIAIGVMSFAHIHARSYLQVLLDTPGVEVLSSDPDGPADDPSRGERLASAMGVTYVDSYEELVARVDAVVITGENNEHRALVELAATAGCAILCEKPLATTEEDAEAIDNAVTTHGVPFMLALPVRFTSAFTSLRSMVDRGDLGRVVAYRAANNGKLEADWFVDPDRSGGGAIMDHVIHVVDLISLLVPSGVVSAAAATNRVLHRDVAHAETGAVVSLQHSDGTIGVIDCSFSQPESAPTWGGLQLSVLGTRGSVDLDVFRPRLRGLDARSGVPIELPYGADADDVLLRTFIEHVRAGTVPVPGMVEARRLNRTVLAARDAGIRETTVGVQRG